jgi:hypothetical protein
MMDTDEDKKQERAATPPDAALPAESDEVIVRDAVDNASKVIAAKVTKPTRHNVSMLPLQFKADQEDSTLKTALIEQINSRNLAYSDLFEYCSKIMGGDPIRGQKLGYNLITGMRKRRSMLDTTFSLWCDFLSLRILIVDKDYKFKKSSKKQVQAEIQPDGKHQ